MSYSQSNEEQIILDYFKGYVGTFIDIGSNDGITFSNVRALAERNWKGIFVEPSPKAFERLQNNYEGLNGFYFYQFALGSHNGKAFLQESSNLIGKDDVALVSTFHPSEMERFKSVVKYTPIEVKVFTWKTFLNRLPIKTFDFISCDCEGNELEILPDMDLTNTRCICIEFNGRQDLKLEYEKYLEGFRLIYTSSENLIYVR